jgi:hypothetical protein
VNSAPRERIALVFGIPLDRGDFMRRAASSSWDYGRQLLSTRSAEEAFGNLYAPVCAAAQELTERAKRAGVSVYATCTLEDLSQACARHAVVVLVAHWRGSRVVDGDISGECADTIRRATTGPLACVAVHLAEARPSVRGLAAALNRTIEAGTLWQFLPSGLGHQLLAGRLVLDALSRDVLDASLPAHLKPGNQLELADGLYSMGAIADAMPREGANVFDLSCCTSSVLGTYLKLVRGDELDIIMGDQLIVPAPQVRMIDATFEFLMNHPGSRYAQVRRTIARALEDWNRDRLARSPRR